MKKVGHLTAERQTGPPPHQADGGEGHPGHSLVPHVQAVRGCPHQGDVTEQFTVYRQFWKLCMKQTEQDKVLEERRAALRRGQRERRKLRMAA